MRVKEVIVVEGKYDKIAVLSAVDATVIETKGFGIFSQKEKAQLLRKLSEKRGIILFTDSDGAGLVIRNYLKGAIPGKIKQAYIPQIRGKEKRKPKASKEGLLGVEGVGRELIIEALRKGGATFEGEECDTEKPVPITKTDLYTMGLSGGADSSEKRKKLLISMGLPDNLSSNAMLEAVNIIYSRDEFLKLVSDQFVEKCRNLR